MITMTLQDTRLDILARGIFINEGKIPDDDVSVTLLKYDTDGLKVQADFTVDLTIYGNEEAYVNILKNKASAIESYIVNRHAQDINRCEHKPVLIGNRKACTMCMGNFGDRIVIDINKN
jgi:hypothetical protein